MPSSLGGGTTAEHEQHGRERIRATARQYPEILTTLGEGAVRAESCRHPAHVLPGLALDAAPPIGEHDALHRLTYVSLAKERRSPRILEHATAIAHVSAARNAEDGLVGAISVGDGWFAQVLEGPIEPLLACFDRILCDPRHEDIRVLDFGPIETRRFDGWSMAFSGEVAPELVRSAVADYATQEALALACSSESGLALAEAMFAKLVEVSAASD